MDTFLYISDKYDKITSNTHSNTHTNESNYFNLLLFGVFLFLYVSVRICELYIIPNIPAFLSSEFRSFIRISSFIIPIIFGISYFKKSHYFNP